MEILGDFSELSDVPRPRKPENIEKKIAQCLQVRRALLRAEPELPRSRLRGARGTHTTVGTLEDGGEAAGQTRLQCS
ncbi:hypothetical protein NDU88_010654 [Pleurodeles waltl]|uniref:Uncharacterized protein n=1 Tax=Pleurodeles waltl TaxID=8319 RepID=A0AAV7QYU7_PLEWA|nr:hypothetical protein NDU88_010654 [Pleurodeles waltl]